MSDRTHTYIKGDSRGRWLIIAEGAIDEAQVSGRWIKCQEPMERLP